MEFLWVCIGMKLSDAETRAGMAPGAVVQRQQQDIDDRLDGAILKAYD